MSLRIPIAGGAGIAQLIKGFRMTKSTLHGNA